MYWILFIAIYAIIIAFAPNKGVKPPPPRKSPGGPVFDTLFPHWKK
jgi:hypothetical protein